MSKDDMDVFDMFGAEPEMDPRLVQALQDLAEAVYDLPGHSQGFRVEPDLLPVTRAVQDVLEAAGYDQPSVAADRWVGFEMWGRAKLEKDSAWLRCDALFRLDQEAAKAGGWRRLDASQKETRDSSYPLLSVPTPPHAPKLEPDGLTVLRPGDL